MPEPQPSASLHQGVPIGQVLVQPAMTKADALAQLGWIKPFDYVIFAIIMIGYVTLFFWWVFGNPQPMTTIIALLMNIIITQFWVISLIFRCSDFVLETRADINMLPDAAARIVMSANRGR